MKRRLFQLTVRQNDKGYFWHLEEKIKRWIFSGYIIREYVSSSWVNAYYKSVEEAKLEALGYLKRSFYLNTSEVEVIIHEKDGTETAYAHNLAL